MHGGDLHCRKNSFSSEKTKLIPCKMELSFISGSKSLLVNEGGTIGPQEKDCKGEDQYMADQGQEVILHQLEQDPYCSGNTKSAS